MTASVKAYVGVGRGTETRSTAVLLASLDVLITCIWRRRHVCPGLGYGYSLVHEGLGRVARRGERVAGD